MRNRILSLLLLALGLTLISAPASALAATGDPIVVAEDTLGPPESFRNAVDRVSLAGGNPTQLTGPGALPKAAGLAFTSPTSLVTVGFQSLARLNLSNGQLVTFPSVSGGDMKDVAVAADGSILATDGGPSGGMAADGRLVRLDQANGNATMVAEGGNLINPLGIAIAEDGMVYVTNSDGTGHGQVVRIDPTTGAQSIVASTPLVSPWGIAFLPNGDLVVADSGYNGAFRGALVRIDPATGAQTPLLLEHLSGPIDNATGVAVDASGEVLVTERSSAQIDRVNLATGVAQLVAGSVPSPLDIELEPSLLGPTTTLLSGPSGTSRNPTPTLTFAPSRYGAQSSCEMDRGPVVPCRRTFTSAALAPGPHSFQVFSTILGVRGPSAIRNFTIDPNALDTVIDFGPSDPTNDTTPTFTFEAPGGGTTFTCGVDADTPAPCATPFTIPAPLPEGTHTFTVRANGDAIGDSRSFTVDTTPPETAITSGPGEGISTNATQPTFTFSSSEGQSSFACTLDAAAVPCTAVFTPATALGEGAHTLTVAATDAAGNPDPSPSSRHFTVDTTPPETTITGGPNGTTTEATPTFTFSASEGGVTFRCSIDSTTLSGCASPFTVAPALPDGLHTFRVQATDAAGNIETTVRRRDFTVDSAVPDTSITAGPAGPTNKPSPTFEFQSTKPGSTFACSVDGGAAALCASPFQVAALAEGAHTFSVTATDALGHPDPTPASLSFSVDTTPPQTTLGAGPGPITSDRTPTFAFTSEAGATFTCRVDAGPAAACTSRFNTPPLNDGRHTVVVTATDLAGNVETTPPQFEFMLDTVPPQTRIDSGPSGDTTDPRPIFTFSANGPGTFKCSLDSGAPVSCDRSFQPPAALPLGPHTFTVTAADEAGNTAAAQRRFNVVAEPTGGGGTPPPGSGEPPKPGSHEPIPANLHLSSTLRAHTLRLHATADPSATGSIAVTVTARAGHTHLRRQLKIALQAGHGSATLHLPASVSRVQLVARYAGDAGHTAETVRARVS